jgi:tight adherence protein B
MGYLLLLLPVASGLLLWWVIRSDNRQQIVQQRLAALSPSGISEPAPSLERTIQQTVAFIPKDLQAWVNAVFAAAGNRIGSLHLGIAGLLAAAIAVGFANQVMGLNPALVSLSGLAAMALAPVLYLRVAQSHYRNRFLNVFPDALDLVRRGIRAGLPVNEALVVAAREIADPVGGELRRALDQVQLGVSMIDALHSAADRVRVPDFRFMVVALALQQKTGGSLAETLANLSAVIRARKALRLKARSLSAEAKVSAMVLGALPFVVGGAMFVMNRSLMQPMFVDPRGRFMIGLAFVSLMSGMTTIYVLVKRAVR